jgi:hypothetical protein
VSGCADFQGRYHLEYLRIAVGRTRGDDADPAVDRGLEVPAEALPAEHPEASDPKTTKPQVRGQFLAPTWGSTASTPNGVRTRVATLRERQCCFAWASQVHLAWPRGDAPPSRPTAFTETGPVYGTFYGMTMTPEAPATA